MKQLKTNTSDFKIEIGTRFKDEKRDIIITDRKKIQVKTGQWCKYYKYKCYKCGFECGEHYSIRDDCYKEIHWIIESSLLKGVGCACCSNSIVVKGINNIGTTNPHLVKYFVNIEDAYKFTNKSNKKILVKCLDCGTEKNNDYL